MQGGLTTPERATTDVRLVGVSNYNKSAWVRDGAEAERTMVLPIDPARIEWAALHLVLWDGGAGRVEHPFELNGQPIDVFHDDAHDTKYQVIEIEPHMLRRGANTFFVTSNTEHHGFEILLPGPTLVVRYTTD